MKYFPEDRFRLSECTGCRICEGVCPSHAVHMLNGHPVFDRNLCISCGHCGVYCPVNAFSLDPIPIDMTAPKEYRALLETRRSIRKYSDKVPSEDEISVLISVLSQIPTGVNRQDITVRVVRGHDAVTGLLKPVRKLFRILSCTGILQILGMITGMSDYFNRFSEGEDIIFRGAPVVLFFHVPRSNPTWRSDGVIAATAVMYHAVSMGLGTLWNGIAEKLYLITRQWHTPDTRKTRLTAVLCVGYPALQQKWKAPERSFKEYGSSGDREDSPSAPHS